MEAYMGRSWPVLIALSLTACASNPLPPPNSVQSRFDSQVAAVRVMVSDLQPRPVSVKLEQRTDVIQQLAAGISISAVARTLKLSRATIMRVRNGAAAASA
jgi:DNA-binding NarL/FixJ family response regulator